MEQQLVLREPDWSKVEPRERLREGLQALRQRAESERRACYQEVTQGDFIRHGQQLEAARWVESQRQADIEAGRTPGEPVDAARFKRNAEAMKLLRWTGFRTSIFSLWTIADAIAQFHKLERPPECPLNDANKQTDFAFREACATLVRWCDDREAEQTANKKGKQRGNGAENEKIPRTGLPSDPDTVELCEALAKGLKAGKTVAAINREFFQARPHFTAAMTDSTKKSSRNWRHLWDPTPSAET